MPMIWTGQPDVAEKLVKKNVEAFERAEVDIVLTICPSCGLTWKVDIPKIANAVGCSQVVVAEIVKLGHTNYFTRNLNNLNFSPAIHSVKNVLYGPHKFSSYLLPHVDAR